MALDWSSGFGVNLSLESEKKDIPQSLRSLCYYLPENPTFTNFAIDPKHLLCTQIPGISPTETYFVDLLNKKSKWTIDVIEFISYERLFVSDLNIIFDHIFPTATNTLYSKIEKNLRSDLESILGYHHKFLKLIESLAENLPSNFIEMFIDSFSTTSPIFKSHETYLNHFIQNEGIANSYSVAKSQELSEYLDGKVIIQVLRAPVQWLERASQFAQQLKNNLSDIDPKRIESLENFTERCKNLLLSINSIPKLEQISKNFVTEPFPIVVPGRRFIMEGVADKHCRKKVDHREIILFSDFFIYAQNKGGFFILPQFYDLVELKVEEKDPKSRCLYIYAPRKSFVLEFRTIDMRHKWFLALSSAIQNAKENCEEPLKEITYAPIWIPDKEASSCMVCHAPFTTFNRRHHCRVCGRVVCKKCLPYKLVIPNISPTSPVFVCTDCFYKFYPDEKK